MADALLILARIVLFAAVLAPVVAAVWKYVQKPAVRAIFKRNVSSYFAGVLGYLFIVVFVVAAVFLAFPPEFFTDNESTLDHLNRWFPLLLVFLIPAITMTTWADEKKLGTDELLFTLPATDLEILLAKYLSVATVYTTVLVFSAPVVVTLAFVGNPDWGLVLSNYLGYWLAGISLLSAGMFASSLTSSPTVSFILGAVVCAVPVLMGDLVPVVFGFLNLELHQFQQISEVVSVPEQLRDFGLGMIPLSGLLYFASLSLFMLYLNLVVISERHWSRSRQTGMGAHYVIRTLALLVALVSLNVIAAHASVRADMTAENLYSLSGTTRTLIDKIDNKRPVTIQAFLSQDVPTEYTTVRRRLIGLLRQYDQLGGGRIEVRFVDVEPFSTEAEQARAYGIEPQRLVEIREGRRFEQNVYLGLVITSSFDEVIIPFLGPGTPLEYELTRSLRTVSNEERLTVGILDTDANVRSGSQGFSLIVDELKKQYEVEHVSPDNEIEDGKFDVLLAVMPSSLTQPQMENFVAYVKQGNPVLIFDDPFPWVFNTGMGVTQAPRLPKPSPGGGMFGMQQPQSPPKADGGQATTLLRALGITWDNGEVVWDTHNPHKEFFAVVPREFVFITNTSGNSKAINPDSRITRGFDEVLVVFAGTVPRPGKDSGVDFTPLLSTGPNSGIFEWDEFSEDSFDPFRMSSARRIRPDRVGFEDEYAHVVAARVQRKAGGDKIDAVFVADIDMISDWFFEQRERMMVDLQLDNVEFVLNAVDVLSGDESFLDLRTRRPKHRTLERFENLTRQFVQTAQKAEEKVEEDAKAELERIKESFKKQREEIEANENLDPRAKAQMLRNLEANESRQLEVEEARIENEKRSELEQIAADRERKRRAEQNWIIRWAVLLAPIPAILLGFVVLTSRALSERRDIAPARHV
ncbi:MAG: Gldg family protein [Planctomycetes bacterium]|nr:Gldg family protein [Planctomycetota bacterium]